jgi:hypothetical protein
LARAGRDVGIGRDSSAGWSSMRRSASRSQPRRPCAIESSGGGLGEDLARAARTRGWRAETRVGTHCVAIDAITPTFTAPLPLSP